MSNNIYSTKYHNLYKQIIELAKSRYPLKEYTELHHIIPKCLGGTDEQDNLVDLTAREHFLCHWMLVRIYPKNHKLKYAWNMMCCINEQDHNRYTSYSYKYARENFSKATSEYQKGKRLSEEHKAKLRRPTSDKQKESVSKANASRTWSKESRAKLSKSLKGRKFSKESLRKMSEAQKRRYNKS